MRSAIVIFLFVASSVLVSGSTASTTLMPPVAPAVPAPTFFEPASQPDDLEVKEVAAGDRFHNNVIKAAIKARKEGKITRSDVLKLRVAMLSPAFRAKAKELATIQMLASDQADQIPMIGENIDWDKLLEFIEKLIPLILKLIEIIAAA